MIDCTQPGACAPHRIRDFPSVDVTPLVGAGSLEGEDYLRLNVWAPATGDKHRVMVWIHRGGFVVGSKDAPVLVVEHCARKTNGLIGGIDGHVGATGLGFAWLRQAGEASSP